MTVDSFFKKYPLKTFALLVFVMLFIFYFEKKITDAITRNFLTQPDFSNFLIDAILLVFVLVLSFYIGYKLLVKNYLPSLFQKKLTLWLTILTIYLYNKSPWNYLEDNIMGVSYVLYILVPLMGSIIFYLMVYFWRISDEYFNFSIETPKVNTLISDDPILDEEEDILSYQPKINRLTQILLKDNYKKSVCIGLIGPWGNGKSSAIHMTQKQLNAKISFDEIVIIHFLPYLNHNESDIINEFFTSFSNKLSEFSGKLSNQILQYAKKLTEAYKGNNVLSLLEKPVSNFNQSSAKELYESINEILIKINKKIIVFVDDLDRLSGKEIIQVLKLIRNTANFHNTIFVVAMDKDYVINRLKADNNISSTRFIDKFFQLEIYLPEIDKNILTDFVYQSLKDSVLNNTSDFEIKLQNGLNHKDNLFENYIKNIRDAKRLVNQIIFDYNFLRDEINFKDFMNFTYFKLKYPKFMEILSHNRLDFLELTNSEYHLKEKPLDENTQGDILSAKFNEVVFLGSTEHNDYSYLKKYAIWDLLSTDKDCLKNTLNIDCDDALLLSKTLAYLFGKQNKLDTHNSIKKENNFHMLMQQRVFENILRETEFQQLVMTSDKTLLTNLMESFHSQNKLEQVLIRLDYFSIEDKSLISNVVIFLFMLYEDRNKYGIYDQQILNKIGVYVEKLINDNNEPDKVQVEWIKQLVFEGELLSNEDKLSILGELYESKEDNNLWYLEENYIKDKAFELFEEYLSQFNNNLWDVNNYGLYGHYHSLKYIDGLKDKINNSLKEFWIRNDIELLCAQSTDTASFSLSTFKMTDTVAEEFGSKSKFHEFVKNHSKNPSDEVKEFLELYYLHAITNYSQPIVYNFKHSQRMQDKIEYTANAHGRSNYDENENRLQIVFETDIDGLIENLVKMRKEEPKDKKQMDYTDPYPDIDISYKTIQLLQFSNFYYKDKYYLFVSYDKKLNLNPAIEIFKAFEAIALKYYGTTVDSFKPYKTKIISNDKILLYDYQYLRVISIQRAEKPST